MSETPAAATVALAQQARHRARSRTRSRRAALFTAIIMSGGLLLVPRLPLLFLLFLLYLLAQRNTNIKRALLPAVAFIVLALFIEVARPNGADALQVLIRSANFLAGLLLANLYYNAGTAAFKEDLYTIVKWFPAQAIVTTVLATFLPFLFVQIPGTDIQTFLLVLFHHSVDTELSFGFVRPDGLFWEPGVFQIYLNLCLYLALFERRDLRMAIVAAAGVVCTQSTTGIFVAVLLLGAFVLMGMRKGRLLPSIGFAIVLVPIALYASVNFANKYEGEARGSFLARQYDTLTGLAVAAEHPWIGVGFDVENYMEEARRLGFVSEQIDNAVFEDRRGNSNGLTQPLYSLGLVLGTFFLVCLLRQSFVRRRLLLGGILVLSLTSEPLLFTPFFLMLVYTGMTRRQMPEHAPAVPARARADTTRVPAAAGGPTAAAP